MLLDAENHITIMIVSLISITIRHAISLIESDESLDIFDKKTNSDICI